MQAVHCGKGTEHFHRDLHLCVIPSECEGWLSSVHNHPLLWRIALSWQTPLQKDTLCCPASTTVNAADSSQVVINRYISAFPWVWGEDYSAMGFVLQTLCGCSHGGSEVIWDAGILHWLSPSRFCFPQFPIGFPGKHSLNKSNTCEYFFQSLFSENTTWDILWP